MRVAILGGTFDPVHNGHVRLAEEVRDRLGYDRVLLVPAAQSPHKEMRPAAGAADRLAMVRLATLGREGLSASDFEVNRGGQSFTIVTVESVARELTPDGRPGLVIGADLADLFPSWKDAEQIATLADLIVVSRPGYAGDLPWDHESLDGEVMTESSSEIRRRIARGDYWEDLVPESVARYILEHQLYSRPAG